MNYFALLISQPGALTVNFQERAISKAELQSKNDGIHSLGGSFGYLDAANRLAFKPLQ